MIIAVAGLLFQRYMLTWSLSLKYRRKVFQDWHYQEVRVIFARVCEKAGAQLVEIDGEGDHVHLLVHYPPTVYLPELVNSLKGVSFRLLESQIPGAKT